jgi:glycine/D-amino acid oxidase-like deaminating enzyme
MIATKNWGNRPWVVDFHAPKRALPETVDFAVVGGGFTGLAAAAWLRKLDPSKSIALFEAGEFGEGSSGHTGGIALAETATGDLPGLGDVLKGYQRITRELKVDSDLTLPGCYELARTNPLPNSPMHWDDSGDLCATNEVPGGTIDPGKTVSGLARAAEQNGVLLFEHCNVESAHFGETTVLSTGAGVLRAGKVLFAANAYSSELTGMKGVARSAFTTALMTEPLSDAVLKKIGLADRKPFYTVDLPYLWGRLAANAVIFGAGLVFCEDWRELNSMDVTQGQAVGVFDNLERRIRRLAKPLENIRITHRWGGPISIADQWRPVFRHHKESQNIVLGSFSGHGVTQSVYLGAWAAEALLGKRALPDWT